MRACRRIATETQKGEKMTDEGTQSEQGRMAQVIAICALLVAVGAAVVAVVALNKKPAAAPKVNVALPTAEVQTLKTEVAALHALVATADGTLVKLTTCLPELSGQITGLSVESSYREVGGERYLTNAYLKPGKQISTYCTSTLEAVSKP